MVGKRAVLVLSPTKALWCDLTQATSSQHVKKDQKDFLCGTSEQPVSIFCMGSILSQRVDAVALTTVDMLTLEGLQDLNVGRRCWPCSSEAREQIARFFFYPTCHTSLLRPLASPATAALFQQCLRDYLSAATLPICLPNLPHFE